MTATLALSVGQGRTSTRWERCAFAPSGSSLADALRLLPPEDEAWFSFHQWETGRQEQAWISATGTVVDLDCHAAAVTPENTTGKTAPPTQWRQALVCAIEAGKLPGSVFHHTTNGERIYFLFPEPVTDARAYRRAHRGACAVVEQALRAAMVPLDTKGISGYQIDSSVEDLAQFFWSPRAKVKGTKRDGAPRVLRETPYLPVELAAFAPAERPPAERVRATRTRAFSSLAAAREAFNADHAEDWQSHKGTCPICGHHDCFGRLPQVPAKWFCWSANHTEGVGQRTDRGWFGDALDVAAHLESCTATELVKRRGYLAEVREPGCDDGEEPRSTDAHPADSRPEPEFIPFSGARMPAFPIDALPAWLARYVEAVARHMQVPPDGPAISVLATLAAVCAKRIRIRRIADGYEQPLNVYLLGLGEPGERKSQIVSEVMQPLRQYEMRLAEEMGEQVARATEQRKLEEARAQWIRRTLASGKTKGDSQGLRAELDALAVELAKPPLRSPRLVTSAPTQGALEQLLADNGERIALMGAEGGIFSIIAGRYAGNSKAPPDMDVLLAGWSGDAGDSDRVTRTGARLKAPAISIGLFVQPQVFREMTAIYGADEKGLTSRFLIALVESNAHRQSYLGQPMDEVRRADWRHRVGEMLQALPADREERTITLPTDVLRPAEAFFEEVTAQMAPGGPLALPALRAFGSKLRGQLERLIGLLHVAQHGPEAPDTPCAETTVAAAVTLARYFLAHGMGARSAVGADPVIVRAQRLIEYCLFNRIATFTRRDAQMNRWGGCRKPEDLDAALAELRQRGYLTKADGAHHVRPELLR